MINYYRARRLFENDEEETNEIRMLSDIERSLDRINSKTEAQAIANIKMADSLVVYLGLLKQLTSLCLKIDDRLAVCEQNVAEIKRLLTEHVEFGPGTEFAQNAAESFSVHSLEK